MLSERLAHSYTLAFVLFVVLVALILSTVNAQDEAMTITDCITASGYTSEAYGEVATLHGVDAWQGGTNPAFVSGEIVTRTTIDTDTGERLIVLLAYDGGLYVFVYQDIAEPGAYERISENRYAHHGACFLRIE